MYLDLQLNWYSTELLLLLSYRMYVVPTVCTVLHNIKGDSTVTIQPAPKSLQSAQTII